jgi:hypothetical protein
VVGGGGGGGEWERERGVCAGKASTRASVC